MIAGTIAFEDLTVHFTLKEDEIVQYTVCDALRGHDATLQVHSEVFFNAMDTAMSIMKEHLKLRYVDVP